MSSNPALTPVFPRTELRALSPQWFTLAVFVFAAAAALYIYSGCCITLRPPVRSDGYGYYAYLTSFFVDGNLTMKTAMSYRRSGPIMPAVAPAWNGIAPYPSTGRLLDKYTMGAAVLQSPFFLASMAYAKATGDPPYSMPYQIANVISALFYVTLGTFLLVRSLEMTFDSATTVMAAAGVMFGTSLFSNATFICSFSHVYSFFLFSFLVLATAQYVRIADVSVRARLLHCLGIGLILGFITLTRVPNVIGAILPFAAVCERYRKTGNLRAFALELLCGLLGLVLVFGVQMTYWFLITGHLLLNSYQGEHFDWAAPHLMEFLFSVRRGLFFWSPVLWLAILGLPRFIRHDRAAGLAVAAILILEVYICSCWWSWWFGMSFESRPVSDMMPLVAFPLAYGLEWLKSKIGSRAPAAIVLMLVFVNVFLMLCYWKEYLPWDNPTLADISRLPRLWIAHAL